MKYLRLSGIALLAIFALTAVMASTASAAEPPALITYAGSGAFTLTSGKGKLETSGGLVVACASDQGTGQLGGKGGSVQARTAELTVLFNKCESVGKPCTSAGEPSGSIITTKLLGIFGRIKPGEAGVLLSPKAGIATQFIVPVKCGTINFEASKSVIGTLKTPSGKEELTSSLIVKFEQKGGLQLIKSFEGGGENNNIIANLGGGPEEAGLESEATLTLVGGGSGILLA
jgi:hypothetical protein